MAYTFTAFIKQVVTGLLTYFLFRLAFHIWTTALPGAGFGRSLLFTEVNDDQLLASVNTCEMFQEETVDDARPRVTLVGFKRLRRFWCRSGSYDVAEDEPKATRITFKKEYTLEEHEQEGATGEGHQTQTRDRPTPFDRSQNQPVSQPKLNTKEEGVIDSKQTLNDRHLKEEQLRRENEKKDSEDEIKDLKQENRKLEREKEEALLRLSELVSLKLRDNNPDIVDLSDAYRPTKLAEMFSELYDNEWTAAFIVMEENGFKDRQTIDFLLDVLMSLPNNDKVKKSLKDARKAVIPNLVPEMEQKFRVMIGEKCKDVTLCLTLSTNAFMQYVATCIKLCLLMNANDPPVVISYPGWVSCEKRSDSTEGIDNQNMAQSDGSSTDTQEEKGNASSTEAMETQRFSKDLFKEYTKRGKFVKFYVWPVVYLHEKGPLLAKGIAQGTEENIDCDQRWEWYKESDSNDLDGINCVF
ncbi:hypothetical protein MAR_022513 [Mya arenaria]|uniref:Mitochondria-eating protein C-terminal domain-containing protein n=1 Tax=Mya arenaria TaxID=6604 RepID=A0ABY7DP61_MYAAR|nr:hypothetical protein MAR_022513 [Mya arenaria]